MSEIRKSRCCPYFSLESVFNSEQNYLHQTCHFVSVYEKYIFELLDLLVTCITAPNLIYSRKFIFSGTVDVVRFCCKVLDEIRFVKVQACFETSG